MIVAVGPEPGDLIQANRFYVGPVEAATGRDNDAFVAELTAGNRP